MEVDRSKYQIFCDLDGVLCDLIGGASKYIYEEAPDNASENYRLFQQKARDFLGGKPLTQENLNKTSSEFSQDTLNFFWRVMKDNRKLWMGLDWTPEGKRLWDYIKDFDPIILSKPTDLQSVIGKKKWVKDNLGLTKEKVQIRYDKTPYAQYNGKTGILIDDFKSNTSKFSEASGLSVLYRSTDQAIKELKKMGF